MKRIPVSSTVFGTRLCRALLVSWAAVGCGAESQQSDPAGDAAVGAREDAAVNLGPSSEEAIGDLPGASDGETGGLDASSPGTAPGSDPTTAVDPGGFISVGTNDAGIFEVWCGSHLCACSDGDDNEGDGLSDGFDSECTGPFDDDEGSFATGIPGDNRDPKWQDCFFDGNSGAGDDDCRYHTECLTGERAADDSSCQLTEACVEYCAPLTPPGCDCFGCCEVSQGDTTINVMLGETCSLDQLDDEDACPRCQPTDTCANECGECELCLGQTLEDLPSSCFGVTPPPGSGADGGPGETPPGSGADGGAPSDPGDPGDPTTTSPPDGPGNVCDNGEACVASTECSAGSYCRLGCCTPFQSNIR